MQREATVAAPLAVVSLVSLILVPKAGFIVDGLPMYFVFVIGLALWMAYGLRIIQMSANSKNTLPVLLAVAFAIISLAFFPEPADRPFGLAVMAVVALSPAFHYLGRASQPWTPTIVLLVKILVTFSLLNWLVQSVFPWSLHIPHLTFNDADEALLLERHNLRSGLTKAMGTYQNGALLGMALVLLGPIVLPRLTRVWMVLYFALVLLTLSRTAWVGLALLGVPFAWKYRKRRWMAVGLLTAFLGASAFFFALIARRNAAYANLSTLGGRDVILQQPNWLQIKSWFFDEIAFTSLWNHQTVPILLAVYWIYVLNPIADGVLGRRWDVAAMIFMVTMHLDFMFVYVPIHFIYWFVRGHNDATSSATAALKAGEDLYSDSRRFRAPTQKGNRA